MNNIQIDLFASLPAPEQKIKVNPAEIRARLHAMLAEIKAAPVKSPWNERVTGMNCNIFPQMANWLPADEADQLRAEFRAQLQRLAIAA